MEIRRARGADIDAVVELEKASFAVPWSRSGFLFELRSEYADFLLACEGERLLGFAIAHLAGDDSELFNICVAESERGRGIGGALIDECVRLAEKRGAGRMLLEVRASNKPARSLYLKKGFQVLGVRRSYYELPTEDAVMMERELEEK